MNLQKEKRKMYFIKEKRQRIQDLDRYLSIDDIDELQYCDDDQVFEDIRCIGTAYWNQKSGWPYTNKDESTEHLGYNGRVIHKIANEKEMVLPNIVTESHETEERVRNRVISDELKEKYNHCCQICGGNTEITPNEYLTNTHHLHSFADNGPDIKENMVVVCINCHAILDAGGMYIDPDTFHVYHFDNNNQLFGRKITLKHDIKKQYLLYQKEKFKGFI